MKILAMILLIVLGLLAVQNWLPPSPQRTLDIQLNQLEYLQSARLSWMGGQTVRVTVTLDSLITSDDEKHPPFAAVHLKRDGREYERLCLIYNRENGAWERAPENGREQSPAREDECPDPRSAYN